jgi:hypothetical protein
MLATTYALRSVGLRFGTQQCWSSTKPIKSAIGSLAISSLASSESVK